MKYRIDSDVDYLEACNPRHRTEPEPAPIVQPPGWWQAEFARIAELEKLLAGIRAERERTHRHDPL